MPKHPDVNYYRSGKNPHRQVVVYEEQETGELVTHVVDLSKGYVKTFRSKTPAVEEPDGR